jgi:hypothetical protein
MDPNPNSPKDRPFAPGALTHEDLEDSHGRTQGAAKGTTSGGDTGVNDLRRTAAHRVNALHDPAAYPGEPTTPGGLPVDETVQALQPGLPENNSPS